MEFWEAKEFENSNKVIEQTYPDCRTVKILIPDHIARSFIVPSGYTNVDVATSRKPGQEYFLLPGVL
jgi:hypothetical protein